MELRHRGVDVILVVTTSSVHVLVEEPIHEVAPELCQSGGSDGISTRSCRGISRWGDIIVGICNNEKKMEREDK